jgi:hypothetical protein
MPDLMAQGEALVIPPADHQLAAAAHIQPLEVGLLAAGIVLAHRHTATPPTAKALTNFCKATGSVRGWNWLNGQR